MRCDDLAVTLDRFCWPDPDLGYVCLTSCRGVVQSNAIGLGGKRVRYRYVQFNWSNSFFDDSGIEGCFRVVWWSFNIPGPRIGVVREG
jgi:hypothetical protein